jgi:proteasome lid subunit RPN8/RPN11
VLREHAARTFPDECCGALLADAAGLITARPLENVAGNRRCAFLVSARDSMKVQAEADSLGHTLAGYYHSHPDAAATPSSSDASTAWPGQWTVIVPVWEGVAASPRLFRFDGVEFHENASI